MRNAVQLPVSVAAALMADAHAGYGLPIGGVLATDEAVLPYGVGVDIGCSVFFSMFSLSKEVLRENHERLREILINNTRFGLNANWKDRPASHAILDDLRWNSTPLLRSLKDKAHDQLGSSGGGNHFVEWGIAQFGTFERMALLSHSGSRGVGAAICKHYTEIAKRQHPGLKGVFKDLAWLDMSSEAGQEYWLSMQLAGDFAIANHQVIHRRVAEAFFPSLTATQQLWSRHNFAWRETLEDYHVILHRKGATPAHEGVGGVIPGTMTHASYLVRGLGNYSSLYSASHGAGRRMGRKDALRKLDRSQMDNALKAADVTLVGGGLDEAPQAYKYPQEVMNAQTDLVSIDGYFYPRIVVMAESGQSED